MAEILVLGAGLNGLVTAMLLARDGHSVTILERDDAAPGDDAENVWHDVATAGSQPVPPVALHAAPLAGADAARTSGRARAGDRLRRHPRERVR